MQSNFGALDIELTEEDMQKLSSLKFQKRLVDGSMVRSCEGAQQACVLLRTHWTSLRCIVSARL